MAAARQPIRTNMTVGTPVVSQNVHSVHKYQSDKLSGSNSRLSTPFINLNVNCTATSWDALKKSTSGAFLSSLKAATWSGRRHEFVNCSTILFVWKLKLSGQRGATRRSAWQRRVSQSAPV
jgi:hypothetical protein